MTNFPPNRFSSRALEIYQQCLKICNNKNINIEFTTGKESFVITNMPNEYRICLGKEHPFEDIEINFSHELIHCIQLEEGFPSISARDIKYKNVALSISSVVLDLDVNQRLTSYGYEVKHNNLEEQMFEMKSKLLFAQINAKMNDFIKTPNEFISLCSMIAFCRINMKSHPLVEEIVKVVKIKFPDIYRGQKIIFDTIELYGYNSPRKARRTFKAIIRELKLDKYILIT